MVFSSWILTLGLIKYCQTELNINVKKLSFYFTVFSAVIIAQLPSLWIERSPSYNNWGANLSLASIAIFLHWICVEKDKAIYHLLIIGILIGLLSFIRPPNSVILVIFLVLIMLLFNQLELKFIIYLFLGILISIIFHFTLIESPSSYFNVTKKGFEFDSHLYAQHGLNMGIRYLHEIFVTFKFSILSNKFELISFIILQYILIRKGRINHSFILFYLVVSIVSVKHILIGDCNGSYSLYWFQWRFYSAQIVVFLLVLAAILIKNKKILKCNSRLRNISLALILLTSPFFFSIGTNNIILFTMNFYTSLYLAGILILFLSLPVINTFSNRYLHFNLVLLLLSFGPCFSYLHGRLYSNCYTLAGMSQGNLFEFKSRINFFDTSLIVSDTTMETYLQLEQSLSPFTDNLNYLINFTVMPGLNFLLNLPHPIQSWTLMMKDNFTLKNLSSQEFESSALLLDSNDHKNLAHIQKYFPSFNTTHSLLSTTEYNVGDRNFFINLYIPKI